MKPNGEPETQPSKFHSAVEIGDLPGPPELGYLQAIFSGFWDLHLGRIVTAGMAGAIPCGIQYSDLALWISHNLEPGSSFARRAFRLIRALDIKYLSHQHNRMKAEAAKQKNSASSRRSRRR